MKARKAPNALKPGSTGRHPGATRGRRPAVGALLLRLGDVPELPVASHGEVYAGLHDELAAALNEDVAGQGAGDTPR